ncbi:fumarylacetoacetate hydrolase family protein, partial [Enterococcus faecalis]|uniref:fumarylacetoacetate hydrolase family protein n=1 Tax=Enterococcus faecalis TaxID=1351 RepID=UPI003D6AC04B
MADGAPIIRPSVSEQLDYEGELVAVIGRTARDVPEARALEYVVGYSIFNDASIRDYQFKSPQWTPGKNFDGTGAFGPVFVTA